MTKASVEFEVTKPLLKRILNQLTQLKVVFLRDTTREILEAET